MNTVVLAWIAVIVYILLTSYLAFRGWQKSKSFESYALGAKDISPIVVGLSLSASLTSAATFVTNPGLVFHDGISALLGFGVAAASGIMVGLIFFSKAFRSFGAQVSALTVPQWIGNRYHSKTLSVGFGILSLALITFAVLIVVALSHVLHLLLHIDIQFITISIIIFVFGYVMFGGVNTHAYTNAIQAGIMIIVAFILLGSGIHTLWAEPNLFAKLAAIDPNLVKVVNPSSMLFRNWFEVFFCNFVMGLALVCQPHTLSKTLYLKDNQGIRQFLATSIVVGFLFALVMIIGLFARALYPEIATAVKQSSLDVVVPLYIKSTFDAPFWGGILRVIVSIGLLCAGLSTLEGILLGITTIISSDLYLGIFGNNLLKNWTPEEKGRSALKVGRFSYVMLAVIVYFISMEQITNPTGKSVVIFTMYFIYLLTAASLIPITAGMFIAKAKKIAVTTAAISAVITFVVIYYHKISVMSNNPAFLGAMSILVAVAVFVVFQWLLPLAANLCRFRRE